VYAPFYPKIDASQVTTSSEYDEQHDNTNKNAAREFTSAALLLGDAIHSFPPDLGQVHSGGVMSYCIEWKRDNHYH